MFTRFFRRNEEGFTLIELLIVIVILGILSGIAFPVYINQTRAARTAAMQSDINRLDQAIILAQNKSGQTLYGITGGEALTMEECDNWVDPLTLNKSTDSCWARYNNVLQKISTASGMDVTNLLDPYGRPYMINPNEGELSSTDCRHDAIGYWGDPFSAHSPQSSQNLPFTMAVCGA